MTSTPSQDWHHRAHIVGEAPPAPPAVYLSPEQLALIAFTQKYAAALLLTARKWHRRLLAASHRDSYRFRFKGRTGRICLCRERGSGVSSVLVTLDNNGGRILFRDVDHPQLSYPSIVVP